MSGRKLDLFDQSLAALIGATPAHDFFAKIYEREALVMHHNDAQRFAPLISIDAIDRIVTSVDLKEHQLDLADASKRLTKSDFVDSAGFIDRGAVALRHRDGATIILQQAHQLEAPLGRFCRALEYVFSAHVQTNLYLTPANAQGFKTHYDNHDVFVAQIEGEKHWRLYDKPIDTPYRGERFESGKHAPGELRHEFTLKAGDCAYVPRGMMHDAIASGDAPSLHITIGLITRTWADLMLEAISEVALKHPELRRSLPAGFAHHDFDRAAARAHLLHLAADAAQKVELDNALDLMADAFTRSRAADNAGGIREAGRVIAPDDRFKARPRAPYRLVEEPERITLIAPGRELGFTAESHTALERALSGAPFAVSELGEHGERIAARLLAYGLIVRI